MPLQVRGPGEDHRHERFGQPQEDLHLPAREAPRKNAPARSSIVAHLARARVPPPGDGRRTSQPLMALLRDGPQGRRLRHRYPRLARGHPGEPALPVSRRSRGDAGGARTLTDLELASRLSFFLWSSLPDDELLQARRAAANSRSPTVLEAQVRRMLADPRAHLADARLRLPVAATSPSWTRSNPTAAQFPHASGVLRCRGRCSRRSCELFIDSVLRSDQQRDGPADRGLHLPERAARACSTASDSEGRTASAASRCTDPSRYGLLGKGAVLMAHGVSEPHGAGAARRVDPGTHAGHAAGHAAAQRAGRCRTSVRGKPATRARADSRSTAATRPASPAMA